MEFYFQLKQTVVSNLKPSVQLIQNFDCLLYPVNEALLSTSMLKPLATASLLLLRACLSNLSLGALRVISAFFRVFSHPDTSVFTSLLLLKKKVLRKEMWNKSFLLLVQRSWNHKNNE